jgi:hypothetical protein
MQVGADLFQRAVVHRRDPSCRPLHPDAQRPLRADSNFSSAIWRSMVKLPRRTMANSDTPISAITAATAAQLASRARQRSAFKAVASS